MVQTIIRNFVMAALTVSDSGCSVAQERAAQPGKKVILHVARLLDVKTRTILSDQAIVIERAKLQQSAQLSRSKRRETAS